MKLTDPRKNIKRRDVHITRLQGSVLHRSDDEHIDLADQIQHDEEPKANKDIRVCIF